MVRRHGRGASALCLLIASAGCESAPDEPRDAVSPSATGAVAPTASEATAQAGGDGVDVVSRASPPVPTGPPVVVGQSVDGAALRAANRARLAADQSPVTVLRGGSARELGERICEAAMPKRPSSTRILLKPNIGGFDWFKDPSSTGDDGLKGRITDPEFVRGVVACLKKRGHTRITIADGWGGRAGDWQRLARLSGYEAMAAEEHVALVRLDDDGVFDVEGDKPGKPLAVRGMEKTSVPTLLMPKILAEHLQDGLFVALPKIKAHRFSVTSLGIKGTQGSVMLSDASPAHRQKSRLHRELNGLSRAADRAAYVSALEAFAERIVDVLEVEAPHVVLAEGAPAMNGDGFQALSPLSESVAIGGTNVVLVDRVGAEILGLWGNAALARELGGHATSPLLEVAAKRFGVDLAAPKLAGEGAGFVAEPRPVHYASMARFTIDTGRTAPLAPAEKPVAHASNLGVDALREDGVGDEAAWKRAVAVTWETDYAGLATGIVTHARFLWSSRALHVLWELEGAELLTDTSRPIGEERPKLYEEDCVELFFTPDPSQPKKYLEMEVGPFGHFFDLSLDRAARKEDTAWQSGAIIGTKRDPAAKRVTIEVSFTAPEIAGALTPGARLPIALYRMERKSPRVYLAWSPPRTAKPNFHVPDAFGALVIDP